MPNLACDRNFIVLLISQRTFFLIEVVEGDADRCFGDSCLPIFVHKVLKARSSYLQQKYEVTQSSKSVHITLFNLRRNHYKGCKQYLNNCASHLAILTWYKNLWPLNSLIRRSLHVANNLAKMAMTNYSCPLFNHTLTALLTVKVGFVSFRCEQKGK